MAAPSPAGGRGTGQVPAPISLIARNSAHASDNKIHSDEEARRFGYRAALVPGVTLYAYMTRLVVPYFGADWLARGAATIACLRPIYAGDHITCTATLRREDGGEVLDLACTRDDGTIGATATAWIPTEPGLMDTALPDLSPRETEAVKPPLTPDSVPIGRPLNPLDSHFTADAVAAYLTETSDPGVLYGERAVLPPGMLAGRQARLLRHNFTFGPSIHTASLIQHLAPAPAPAQYRTGGVIRETRERNGHHYLVLDALTTADGAPVARIRHTSIFQVRG